MRAHQVFPLAEYSIIIIVEEIHPYMFVHSVMTLLYLTTAGPPPFADPSGEINYT
jgi:hypothetical protein